MSLNELLLEILRFRDARDWEQFHTPKNLAAALAIEAGEVQEVLLWKTDKEVADLIHSAKGKKRLEEEIADVLIYTLLLTYEVGVNPVHAIRKKMVENARKYPAVLSKGNASKYSELRSKDEGTGVTAGAQFRLFPIDAQPRPNGST
jgi:dCTP diphosphatase